MLLSCEYHADLENTLHEKVRELEGIQVGCGGEHCHNENLNGHAHGHGTMWFVGDPRKLHHHHDLQCILAYKREVFVLRERLKAVEEFYKKYEGMASLTGQEVIELWQAIKQAAGKGE
jgi:hypothetical protein